MAGLGVHGVLLVNLLRVDWALNPQYSYGWWVPVITLGLLARRWSSAPPPGRPVPPPLLGGAVGMLLLLLLPLRLIEEANPEWRLTLWAHALLVVGLGAALALHLGGWPWLRHFGFPLAFPLLGVPWPIFFEKVMIQGLMRWVAGATMEILGLISIPAVQRGNLIEISSGLVGVDEACSGVRSLQSALMVSLFLGEFYGFAMRRRGLLLAASLFLVFVLNVARTSFLVWVVARKGLSHFDHYHDIAGEVVMGVVLVSLWSLAVMMRPVSCPMRPSISHGPVSLSPRLLPFALAGLVWTGAAELATEAWYRLHERESEPAPRWTVEWARAQVPIQSVPIGERALAMLRCSESSGAAWDDARGNRWKMIFLRWEPGRNSSQLAKSHRPDICLPGTGATLAGDLGIRPILVNGLTLPFHQYLFHSGRDAWHVFYCLWPDRYPKASPARLEDGTQLSRLQAVWAGHRHSGQQVLEIAVKGPETAAEAVREVREQLERILRFQSQGWRRSGF